MKRSDRSLLVLDITCGTVVLACAATALWFTTLRDDRAPAMIRELARTAIAAKEDIARAQADCRQQRALLATRQADLSRTGQLPDEAPIEEYFQDLSKLAARNRLEVRGQGPLAARSYPGMLEQRFAYEVSGSLLDLARFLRAIEDVDYWADVSYFKIEAVRSAGGGDSGERVGQLTISLFSAAKTENSAVQGRG